MKCKQDYQEPYLTIILFNEEDVIRTSGDGGAAWKDEWSGALDQLGF